MNYKLCDDTWNEDELQAIKKVVDSNMFSMGKCVSNYERDFEKKFKVNHAIMTSSGSAANLLATAALVYSKRINAGDEVLVTAVSWSTTYFPLYQMGLKLRFVDIDSKTLNVSVTELKNAVTEKTKMVCLVNLLGNPNEFDEIISFCNERNIIVMEDNCESLGAEYNEQQAGTFGLVGTYSTFYSHHLCTMEGGIVVTNDTELYHYMLCIRAHGWTRNLPENSNIYEKNENPFYESFNFIVPGFNLRPIEIEGAVGTEQLKKMDKIIMQRRNNAEYFCNRLKEIPDVRTQKETGRSSWFGFAVILENKYIGKRDSIVQKLAEAQIEVRPIVAGNFTRNKVIEYMDYTISGELINSDYIHDNGFFIGNHSNNNFAQIDYFIDVFKNILNNI